MSFVFVCVHVNMCAHIPEGQKYSLGVCPQLLSTLVFEGSLKLTDLARLLGQ